MPSQPQDPLTGSTNQYGPFTSAITGPLTAQNEAPPVSGAPSRGGAIALYLGKFLQGAQVAKRQQYEKSEAAKREGEGAMFRYAQAKMADPNLSPEGKQALTTALNTALAQQAQETLKDSDKGSKGKDPHPLLALTKQITNAVLGPGENPKHKDFGSLTAQLMTIGEDPKYKIDPNAISAESISKPPVQAQPVAQQPTQQGQTAPQQQSPLAQGYLANQYPATPQQATPPPPGTTPAAAQAPAKTYSTKAEMWSDPSIQEIIQQITKIGQDWTKTLLGQQYAALPDAKETAPKGITAVIYGEDGKIQKYVNAVRTTNGDLVDPATSKTIPGAVEATPGLASNIKAVNPTLTATQQNRQNLVTDMKSLHPDWPEDQINKAVAKLDVDTATNKSTAKLTDEDKLSRYLVDSGQASTPEAASKKAATMLVDLQKAKIKAAQTASGGGGSAFTPAEMDALARWSIASGQQPSFGMGANNPNRTAYQKSVANIMLTGGIGDALEQKTDAKSLSSTLASMQKMKASVGSFESSANKALDNAVAASRAVPRDSSAMVNGWDQWITNHSVDDPQLKQLMVYTETAANEYARVIGSLTGASTNAARDQANSFIRSQLGEQSFEGAVKAMKTDMQNRTGAISDTINGLQEQIKGIGAPQGRTPPPGVTKQSTGGQDKIDPSKDAIKVKGWGVGDTYTNGKKILGFTSDGHMVTED